MALSEFGQIRWRHFKKRSERAVTLGRSAVARCAILFIHPASRGYVIRGKRFIHGWLRLCGCYTNRAEKNSVQNYTAHSESLARNSAHGENTIHARFHSRFPPLAIVCSSARSASPGRACRSVSNCSPRISVLTSRMGTLIHPRPFRVNQIVFVAYSSSPGDRQPDSHRLAIDWNSQFRGISRTHQLPLESSLRAAASLRSPRVSLLGPAVPRSAGASFRKGVGSDGSPPAGANSTAHA
jgi:hypothetical protein